MESEKLSGPYRATKLWNEAILIFREGMPLKKHRHHMRQYDDCFTGSEAVTWLHKALQVNPNFDTVVTREQTVQLLQKFIKAAVLAKVGDKGDTLNQFKDNNSLYKFCSRSPLKDMYIPNVMPFNPVLQKKAIPKLDSSPKKIRIPEINASLEKKRFLEEVKTKAINKQRSQLEVGEVWKSVVLGRLEALMEGVKIEELVPPDEVSGDWIAKNAESKSSQHENLARQLEGARGLPNWIISAMKTVVMWPQQAQQGVVSQSGYEGFEKDVLKEVVKYFIDRETPLIPCVFFKAFSHIFSDSEYSVFLKNTMDKTIYEPDEIEIDPDVVYPMSSKSIENLVLGMSSPLKSSSNPFTQQGVQGSPEYLDLQLNSTNPFGNYMNTPISHSFYGVPSPYCYPRGHHSLSMYQTHESDQILSGSKILTTVLPPNSCFETAFTSESPTTRIIPQRTVDTLHFQRRQQARQSQRTLQFNTPISPEYMRMDMYKKPATSTEVLTKETQFVRKPASDSTYRFQSSAKTSASKMSDKHSLVDVVSGVHTFGNSTTCSRALGDHASTSGCDESNASLGQMSDVCLSGGRNAGKRYSTKQHHSSNSMASKRSQSDLQPPVKISSIDNRPALPPKPLKLDQNSVTYVNIHEMKNSSGGYVNLALSCDDLSEQELDVTSAMKSLVMLMKCSQNNDHKRSLSSERVQSKCTGQALHSTPSSESNLNSPFTPELSLSSIGSYQTPASDDTNVRNSDSGMICSGDYMNQRPLLNLPSEFHGVTGVHCKKIAIEVMQLLLLILPPQNRKKLSLLINFISTVSNNTQLVLSEDEPNLDVLIQAFKHCIVFEEKSEAREVDENENEVKTQVLDFLVREADNVWHVPEDLVDEVQQHITEFEHEQTKASQHLQRTQQWRQHRAESRLLPRSYEDSKVMDGLSASGSEPVLTFCEQVTHQEFEQQKLTESQKALYELLDQIIQDAKMTVKEKQKKLDMFKESYPHIYSKRFPTKEEEEKVLAPKPKRMFSFVSLPFGLKNLRL